MGFPPKAKMPSGEIFFILILFSEFQRYASPCGDVKG